MQGLEKRHKESRIQAILDASFREEVALLESRVRRDGGTLIFGRPKHLSGHRHIPHATANIQSLLDFIAEPVTTVFVHKFYTTVSGAEMEARIFAGRAFYNYES